MQLLGFMEGLQVVVLPGAPGAVGQADLRLVADADKQPVLVNDSGSVSQRGARLGKAP